MRAQDLVDPQFYIDFLPHRAWNWLYWRLFAVRQRRQEALEIAWDKRHGTQTAGDVRLIDVGISPSDAGRGSNTYRPVWEHKFQRSMQMIKSGIPGSTFFDYGSGKGKLLLLASHFPFKKIIGMEYPPILNRDALLNIELYRNPHQRCGNGPKGSGAR